MILQNTHLVFWALSHAAKFLPSPKQRKNHRLAKSIPFDFVLEKLDVRSPIVKPMFGCYAIYLEAKMMLILRDRKDHVYDNGVWLATSEEHHASLQKVFPAMRSVRLLGEKKTAWQNLPSSADDFEESVLEVCEMILRNDPRIGKIPKQKKKKTVTKR